MSPYTAESWAAECQRLGLDTTPDLDRTGDDRPAPAYDWEDEHADLPTLLLLPRTSEAARAAQGRLGWMWAALVVAACLIWPLLDVLRGWGLLTP